MRTALIVLALCVGCRGRDKFDNALAETTAFRDRMCACPDKACVDAVHAEYVAWLDNTKQALGEAKPSELTDYKGRTLVNEMQVCRRAKLTP